MLYNTLMPVRNTVRVHAPNTYFHVYNRGVEHRTIFLDDDDYEFFLSLFGRHLSNQQNMSKDGNVYPYYRDLVQLVAYCLMPNHFHLLVYQHEDTKGISQLMTSVAVAYSMYFNKKYHRRGPLFENRFKASPIFADSYLQHITRYIHLNPKDYKSWRYSSYRSFISIDCPEWLNPEPVLVLFSGKQDYMDFVADYESVQRMNDILKHSFADSDE